MRRQILIAAAIQTLLSACVFVAAARTYAAQPPGAAGWLAVALALAAISLLSWGPFFRKLCRSCDRLEHSTSQIAGGRLDERIPEAGAGHLTPLAANINRMTERFEGILSGQKRFLGDVAHELNAPIARVQFALGVLETAAKEEQQADLEALHDEIQEMSALVRELSSFSKAEFGAGRASLSAVNLRATAQRAADRENVAAEIHVDGALTALAHEVYLTRALSNLLRNARRYAGGAGPVEIRAGRQGDRLEVVVADHGPGLPESELEQVFEPFYRLDPSRTSSTGGKGLGMAIVKSCVEACRGTVFCRNRQPSGLEVVIRLLPES